MKKAILLVVIFAIIVAGVFFHKLDKENIEQGNEPKYCIKLVDEDKQEIKYLGLGYSLYRKYKKSPNEKMGDAESLKFGIWFLEKKEIKIKN